MSQFQILQCTQPECRFRFPVVLDLNPNLDCPKCGSPTLASTPPYANEKGKAIFPPSQGARVEALLDNIRSTYNVGAMFRTADGSGLSHLHLCGITPTPANRKVGKTALGAEETVPWTYHRNALEAALASKEQGTQVWALESSPQAESLFTLGKFLPGLPLLLVVGNEITGVDPGILEICDKIIAIPMQGQKSSLNVAIAFGVAAYYLRYGI